MSDTNTDDLAQATGLAIALLGSLLEGARVLPKGEFSRHVTNLAIVTHETAPDQGDILDQWAAMVAQISRAQPN